MGTHFIAIEMDSKEICFLSKFNPKVKIIAGIFGSGIGNIF